MAAHLRENLTAVQVRFGDSDALGHINNASLVIYAEIGRLAFFSQFPDFVQSLILARITADYRKQVTLEHRVSVYTAVERVGTSSITLRQEIRANDEMAVECTSVVVHFDYATQRSSPLPEHIRHALEVVSA